MAEWMRWGDTDGDRHVVAGAVADAESALGADAVAAELGILSDDDVAAAASADWAVFTDAVIPDDESPGAAAADEFESALPAALPDDEGLGPTEPGDEPEPAAPDGESPDRPEPLG